MNSLFSQVANDKVLRTYLVRADAYMGKLGYTEHGIRHAGIVASGAMEVMSKLGYSEREAELAGVAGFLHDIGNAVSRENHSQVGAILASQLIRDLLLPEEMLDIMNAIGNHDEENGIPANPITAAVIISDKSDVHRERVRNLHTISFDIHDRVNYAVLNRDLIINPDRKEVILSLDVDTSSFEVVEYFEIFLSRMIMCKRAATVLGVSFKLLINNIQII
ncbi:MAG: Ribonuclease Y [candidate division WS2 bacterium]|uniref:Ribonuclease Y n=1 Tax=Psychracetigena formicireducens TaxID=2986056 RepID=A0A9E2BFH1_PSYF1|nr:Ribonuclease Y [Candidatus Psychracetigena formicireducens]MBT9150071.1 Ribonuclease Y [Candidatus Psychracetigena formicireducens]